MAPMSNPEPMPVEVINAVALLGELLGEMTELISFGPRYLCLIYRQASPGLKQAAYQTPVLIRLSGALIDDDAGDSHTTGQCREFAGRKLANHLAAGRIDLLDELAIRGWIQTKLLRLA